jgi:hypothetical protein
MIRLPEDNAQEMANHIREIYSSREDLDDFLLKILQEYPDDPTLSTVYWIGLMVGRLEGKTRIANRLYDLAEEIWAGSRP